MTLRTTLRHLYHPRALDPSGADSQRAVTAGETGGASGEFALMREYRRFVSRRFSEARRGKTRSSETFQNRNEDHAKVVIPYLFKGANKWVHFLTGSVLPAVYGTPGVVNAARNFLRRCPEGVITILTEQPVERDTHPFFAALQEYEGRVVLRQVPAELQRLYKFNFGVNDSWDYRFESSRENAEAMVQFGGEAFANDLERTFKTLSVELH